MLLTLYATYFGGVKMDKKGERTKMKIIPPNKKKCVWMESGVVSYKLCDNNFDCPTCPYDQAMQRKVQKGRERIEFGLEEQGARILSESWVTQMMKLPASQRKCRYMITGEVERKICPSAYECGTCSFDKMMQARLQSESLPSLIKELKGGIKIAADSYYHRGHMWAKPEYGGRVRIGIDDFGRRLIGEISEIMVPDMGAQIKAGEPSIVFRRDGIRIDLLSPIDGVICRVNSVSLTDHELIKASPYEKGWIAIVEPMGLKKGLKRLLYGEDAEIFMEEETDRLISEFKDELKLAADGGEMVEDILGLLDRDKSLKLISMFFNPE